MSSSRFFCDIFESYQNIVINLIYLAYETPKNASRTLFSSFALAKYQKNIKFSGGYYDIDINNIVSFNNVSRIQLAIKNLITLF